MRCLCSLFACFLLCLFLCSCVPQTDFLISSGKTETETLYESETGIFVVINKNSLKYHLDPDCVYVSRMSSANRLEITVPGTDYLEKHGYSACSGCVGKNNEN